MNRLIEAMMKRTVLITSFLLIILVWGGISAYQIQRDYLPPINNPLLMITVQAQAYQADQIKAAISGSIVQSIRIVNGLNNVETNCLDGVLLVSLTFPLNYDMDRAEGDVTQALNHVALPADVDKPVVTRVSTSSFPIMKLSLTSQSAKIDENALRTTVQEKVANELKSLLGVSDVRVTGAGTNGYVLKIRMMDLQKAGLTIEDVKHSISAINPTWVQGKITTNQVSIPVQVIGASMNEQDLQQIPIYGPDGKSIPLSNVADLSRSIVDLQTISRTDGKPDVIFDVLKTPSSNITEVSDRVHERLNNIADMQAKDIRLSVLFDQGEQLKSALNGLLKEGLLGCLLSMICVFFFFRNIRSTVIVALSIPICLLATVGLLKTIGITLNILTVSGLIVAMGRVIDDTIVILDNMYRKVHESEGNVNTTLLTGAVREMIPAIISSTATTVAVYIPIALVVGMISAAFSGFAWSVVFALVTSLFVSIFIVPALYYLWRKGQAKDSAISVEPVAQKVLHWVFQKKGKVIVLFSLLFVVAAVGAAYLPVNFLPANKSGQIVIQEEFPEGTSLPQIDAEVNKIEQYLKSDPSINTFSSVLGSSFTPQFDDVFDAGGGWIQRNNVANLAVSIKGNANLNTVIAQLQKKLPTLSAIAICTVTNQNISGDDSKLKIDLSGADGIVLDNTAVLIRSKLQLVPGLSIEGAADDKAALPRYQITLNHDLIQRLEIKTDDVLQRIREYLSQGTKIAVVTGDQQSTPFLIQTDLLQSTTQAINGGLTARIDPETEILTSIGRDTFTGKSGQVIQLDQIASISQTNGQSVIRERAGRPFSVVTANITSRDVEKVTRQVQDVLDHLQLPSGVKYSFNGASAQVNQMIYEMAIALSVSVLLVLFIISIVFRGWRAPLSVLLCIPLAFIGSVLGLLVFGREWNLAAFIGLLMLSGIVVTNGIVLVDKIERNLASGMDPQKAILQGTASRVRPVLMTAVTTILTLLPLSFSSSGDTIISQTLGIVVVCGMISSTMISLLLIPVIYEFLHRKQYVLHFKTKTIGYLQRNPDGR